MTTEIETVEKIKNDVLPVVAQASSIAVNSPAAYADAATFLKSVKAAQKKVADFFGPMKAKAHAAWKEITGTETNTLAPLTEAEALVKRKMLAYSEEQERIRLAEQRRLQAIADEQARKEREKAEAAAREQRRREEDARRAEAEALERAQAAANAEERAKAEAEAEKARKAADAAAAKAEVREEAAAMVAPAAVVTVASSQPKIGGQNIRKTWKAVVANVALVPREWLVVNEQALQAFAKATKGAVPVAGVRFEEVSMLASSSK